MITVTDCSLQRTTPRVTEFCQFYFLEKRGPVLSTEPLYLMAYLGQIAGTVVFDKIGPIQALACEDSCLYRKLPQQ